MDGVVFTYILIFEHHKLISHLVKNIFLSKKLTDKKIIL